MLMPGKTREYFGIREADRDTTDASTSYKGLSSKVNNHARSRRKLDSTANEKMQRGDPMYFRSIGDWSWWGDAGGEHDQVGVYEFGFKGIGEGKGKSK
jgi:hypothetical protein